MESTNTPAIKAAADECRATFDAEAPQYNITVERFKNRPDEYKYEHTNAMFKLWQAAWRAALATPAIQAVAPTEILAPESIADNTDAMIILTQDFTREQKIRVVDAHARRRVAMALAAVPAQQPDVEGVKLTCCKDSPALVCVGDYYCGRAAAPVAPDLASLTRYAYNGATIMTADTIGFYFLAADVERLLSHSAQAPVEPVTKWSGQEIADACVKAGIGVLQANGLMDKLFSKCISDRLAAAPVEPVNALTDERDIHILLRELLGIAGSNRRGACARLNDMHNLILSFKSKRALLAASPKVEPVSAHKKGGAA